MDETHIKDKIQKAAEELFMTYGVRSISMDDIARHLSVSKKTIYLHFADKEDIVTVAFQALLERNQLEFRAIHENSKDVIDELVKVSACLRHNMHAVNPSTLFDLKKYHPKAWEVWLEFKNSFIRTSVVRNLKKGIAEGYFRPEIDPEVLALVRLELLQVAFDQQLFPRERFRLADVQMQVFEHFVFGITTDKGRKLYLKYKQNSNHSIKNSATA